MKITIRLLLLALICLFAATCAAPGGSPPRPNIILIMADDMGFSDIGCYGGEVQTPNLDKLAERGIRFSQFYNTARCCPTRASLLTGLYPHQAGIGHMTDNSGLPGYQGYLNDRCVTIAEALKLAGYTTLMSGKWHVGENRPHWPCDRGFDHYFGLISGASNFWRLDPGRKMALDNEPCTPPADGFYMTDAFTDHAVEFLDKYGRDDKPFFLYVPYTAPHWPLHAHPEDIAKYKGKFMKGWDDIRRDRRIRMVQMGLIDAKWDITARDDRALPWEQEMFKEDLDLKMAVYAAQIDRMDQGIGRILQKLGEIGKMQDTLILFLADNGGCAERVDRGTPGVPPGPADSFLSYGIEWANASNTPFRLYKHWVHEGGISTPLIAYWPAAIKKPGVTQQTGHLIDIMATCLDVAGAQYPETYKGKPVTPLEGKSLKPIFEGREREGHEFIFWEHEGNKAVRMGRWKLVSKHPGDWELYDMVVDRTETRNLAPQFPEKVQELGAAYAAWAKRSGAEPLHVVQKSRNELRRKK